jgi:tetratricopeptide (TPR) repeat protein
MTTEGTTGSEGPEPAESEPKESAHNEVAASVAGHVVQAGAIFGSVGIGSERAEAPLPQQLPAAPGSFVGRYDELARLSSALSSSCSSGPSGPVIISAINGTGGIGKTALALQWAHQHIDQFPDGQLFVNLRGFDPVDPPMNAATALRSFLLALVANPRQIPVDLTAQTGLFRSLVARKRMLIVLDNARDPKQVVQLLPGSATCTVLVTSRNYLTSLVASHNAQPIRLDILTEAESRQLLAGRLGKQRVRAEPDAVAELVACCAGLPLALGIVAARAAMTPELPLAELVANLRNTDTRLAALDGGDPWSNLRAVFSWSYQALSQAPAEMFCSLGLAPVPDIGQHAVACLTGHSLQRATMLLGELDRACLVQQHAPGRWRMHDLVKRYAARQAHQTDDTRDELQRLISFYLHSAHAADQVLDPHRPPLEIGPPVVDCHPIPNKTAAWAWFEAEHPCLLASQQFAARHGWHDMVWQMAWTLDTFHIRRGHLDDNLTTWQSALTAARHGNQPAVLIVAYRFLGYACALVGRHDDALDNLDHALDLAKKTGDLPGQAHTHYGLAEAWGQRGDNDQAREHATSALRLYEKLDEPVWEADMLNSVGWYSARLGRYEQARNHCEAALTLCRRHNHIVGVADTLNSLGYLAYCTGQYDQGRNHYQQALASYQQLSYTYAEADTLDRLGHTHVALGDHNEARRAWEQAVTLYKTQHRAEDAQRVEQQLTGA